MAILNTSSKLVTTTYEFTLDDIIRIIKSDLNLNESDVVTLRVDFDCYEDVEKIKVTHTTKTTK